MTNLSDNNILLEYLARLRAGLEGLPAGERDDAYRELAQHVEALVEEAVAVGGDKQETVRAALAKFGEPEKIGRKVLLDYVSRNYVVPVWILVAGTVLMAALSWVSTVSISALDLPVSVAMIFGAISGIPIGLALGWVNTYSGELQGFPEHSTGSWPIRWIRQHRRPFMAALIAILFAAVVLELLLPIAYDPRRALAQNTTMLLVDVFCAFVAETYFRRRRLGAPSR